MFRAAFRLALGAAALAAGASPAFAWGKTGHRVVASIADPGLSAEARAHVRLILGTESLDEASTWPDDMRSDPALFWQKTSTPWHYVTVAGTHYESAPPEGDAVTALRRFRAILLDPAAPRAERELALRFVIHIVGDLHQPLHVGKPGDRGGNDVKVTFAGRPTNLHSLWDSALVDDSQLSFSEFAERLQRRTTPEQVIEWSASDPMVWIRESAEIRPTIYPTGTTELGWDYVYKFRPVIERRLQQGGIRLAAYLNELFRKPAPVEAPARGGRTRRHRTG
jgi:hypothetical protein